MADKVVPPTPAETALLEGQQLLQLWISVKTALNKAIAEDPIRPDEETQFLDAKAELTKYQRLVASKLPETVVIANDKIQELMRQATSIANMRALPKADKQGLVGHWHGVFVNLCRAVGALQFLAEGYVPPPKPKAKAGAGKSGKPGAGGMKSPAKKH